MKTITELAPAKINLGLDIIGKREDGYHAVCMVMQTVGLCDKLTLEATSEGGITLTCNKPELSCGEDNLVYKAAKLLADTYGINPNVHIHLEKNIFMAAGLAGGSADAAATLRGLNKFWQLKLSNSKLEELAAKLGSDIPFCVEGGTALAIGRGEIIEHYPDMPEAIVILAKPKGLEVSTGWVYQHYDAGRVIQHPIIWKMLQLLPQGIKAALPCFGNVLETVTIPLHPVIASIKGALLNAGAYYVMMSGSGPTVFAFADTQEQAEKILTALAEFEVETVVTTTTGRKI